MPDDRFIHPRLGHGEKVFQLTDLEFRAWMQYLLSSDDCGVMRKSAITIQGDNERLASLPAKKLEAALTKLVTIGLLTTFSHQGRAYLCQLDWQEWQKVRWPRASVNPQPDAGTLAKCTAATRALFATQAKNHRSGLGVVSEPSPSAHGEPAETPPSVARGEHRLTATAEATATGNGNGAWHGEAFMAAFRDGWKALYGYECSLILKPLQYSQLQEQMGKIHETQMRAALAAYFATEDAYVAKAKHPLGLFLREPLRFLARAQVEPCGGSLTPRKDWTCPHVPACPAGTTAFRCDQRTVLEAGRAQKAAQV